MKRGDCLCAHSKAQHEHFSIGSAVRATSCALCECQKYRRWFFLLSPFWRWFARDLRCPHPAPHVFIDGAWNCTHCNREVY